MSSRSVRLGRGFGPVQQEEVEGSSVGVREWDTDDLRRDILGRLDVGGIKGRRVHED